MWDGEYILPLLCDAVLSVQMKKMILVVIRLNVFSVGQGVRSFAVCLSVFCVRI